MFKTIKNGATLFALAIVLFTSSCNEKMETITRTPEMEVKEINEAIIKLEAKGYNVDTTALGIYYVIHDNGVDSLSLVQFGDTCYLEYTGYLLDGTVFDASKNHFTNGIWEFIYKEKSLISGFENGIALMRKGTKVDLIIPSKFAYGEYGSGQIPAYATLLFSTQMHNVKPTLKP
jgi:FKBP-type peptidyl-prolyl cis-trans isomerase FkpA